MWECGLKPEFGRQRAGNKASLLMWECGLKQLGAAGKCISKASLLMWECGLKPPVGAMYNK